MTEKCLAPLRRLKPISPAFSKSFSPPKICKKKSPRGSAGVATLRLWKRRSVAIFFCTPNGEKKNNKHNKKKFSRTPLYLDRHHSMDVSLLLRGNVLSVLRTVCPIYMESARKSCRDVPDVLGNWPPNSFMCFLFIGVFTPNQNRWGFCSDFFSAVFWWFFCDYDFSRDATCRTFLGFGEASGELFLRRLSIGKSGLGEPESLLDLAWWAVPRAGHFPEGMRKFAAEVSEKESLGACPIILGRHVCRTKLPPKNF